MITAPAKHQVLKSDVPRAVDEQRNGTKRRDNQRQLPRVCFSAVAFQTMQPVRQVFEGERSACPDQARLFVMRQTRVDAAGGTVVPDAGTDISLAAQVFDVIVDL